MPYMTVFSMIFGPSPPPPPPPRVWHCDRCHYFASQMLYDFGLITITFSNMLTPSLAKTGPVNLLGLIPDNFTFDLKDFKFAVQLPYSSVLLIIIQLPDIQVPHNQHKGFPQAGCPCSNRNCHHTTKRSDQCRLYNVYIYIYNFM